MSDDKLIYRVQIQRARTDEEKKSYSDPWISFVSIQLTEEGKVAVYAAVIKALLPSGSCGISDIQLLPEVK